MNTITQIDHAKICMSQLSLTEKELFAGLDDLCKGSGRIYKRLDKKGHYIFFRANGLFSQVYHFLFSKRLDKSDLIDLQDKIANWLFKCIDSPSRFRVEAVFDRVLRQVQKNSHLNLRGTEDLLYHSHAHLNLLMDIGRKLKNLESIPLVNHQKEDAMTQPEIAILHEIFKFPSFPLIPIYDEVIKRVQQGEHPICQSLENLQDLNLGEGKIKHDIQDLKLKAQHSQLSEEEIEKILLAKAKFIELKTLWSRYVDIASFRPVYQELDQLIELSDINGFQISQALNHRKMAEKLVQKNGWLFLLLAEDLKGDFGIASMVLTRHSNEFAIVKEVVRHFGELLILASVQAKDNAEIVNLAVKNNPRAFEFASKRIQTSDLNVAKLAIEERSIRPELVKFILRQNGAAFQFAPEQYKKDPELALIAIQQYPLAFPYLTNNQKKVFIQDKLDIIVLKENTKQFSLEKLEVIIDQALKDPFCLKDDKLKTMLWIACEDIAQSYLKVGNEEEAIVWRKKVEQATHSASPLSNF